MVQPRSGALILARVVNPEKTPQRFTRHESKPHSGALMLARGVNPGNPPN